MMKKEMLFAVLAVAGSTQAFWGKTKLQEQDVLIAANNCANYDKKATEKLIDQIKEDIEGETQINRMWALLKEAEDRAATNHVKLSKNVFYEIIEKNGLQPMWFNWKNYKSLIEHVGEDKAKEIKSFQDACNCKDFSRQLQKYNNERTSKLQEKKI